MISVYASTLVSFVAAIFCFYPDYKDIVGNINKFDKAVLMGDFIVAMLHGAPSDVIVWENLTVMVFSSCNSAVRSCPGQYMVQTTRQIKGVLEASTLWALEHS